MEWQALRPDVPVELTTTVQHGVDFRREGFDAAVVYGDAPNHGLRVRKLFEEQLTPVCAPSLRQGRYRCSRSKTWRYTCYCTRRGMSMTGGCGCRQPG